MITERKRNKVKKKNREEREIIRLKFSRELSLSKAKICFGIRKTYGKAKIINF